MPPRAATAGGVAALAGAAALAAAAIAARGWPEVGPLQVFILISFSLLIGLSTAASP
jgi:hypothetical protein